MSRRKKDPLRELTEPERQELTQLSRSQAAPAVEVARAIDAPGRRRRRRLSAGRPLRRTTLRRRRLAPGRPLQRRGHGRPHAPPRRRAAADLRAGAGSGSPPRPPGPRPPRPTAPRPGRSRPCAGRSRGPRRPAPGLDLHHLARAPRGRGYSYQRTRTWCPTGKALRRRKAGPAVVTDPDADAKKS